MSEQGRAVFLSYASQDAEAAQRICEALRAAGIEVWFDRSELRGGDAWDAAIRKQIKHCGLFIPIISQNTRSRGEGYFRLEWKLAVDRSHLISSDLPFLLPVAIDDTRDDDERTPERFRELQWTRLPRGETPPAFADRVARLLSSEPNDATSAGLARTAAPSATRPRNTPPAPRGWRPVLFLVLALALFGVSYFALGRFVLSKHAANTQLNGSGIAAESARQKSIAVLPFVDLSEKKDQGYFADGLAEELLDLLAKTPGLHVIARTSSFSFKGKSDDIPTIAAKLKVANILEGSVRKSGNQLRVTTELVRASDGEHMWSESYDRKMTDIFKVQDEIAGAVVSALKLKLSPSQSTAANRPANADAYVQYMLGLQYFYQGSDDSYRRSISAYRKAIALDPNYAAAYAGLALADDYLGEDLGDRAAPARALAMAERSITLAPEQPLGYSSRGDLRSFARDWTGAQADYVKALELDPDNPIVLRRYSRLLIVSGRLPEAIAIARRVTELDPLSSDAWKRLSLALMWGGSLQSAREANHQSLAIDPTNWDTINILGLIELLDHKPSEALTAFRRIEANGNLSLVSRLTGIAMAECSLGHAGESQRALNEAIAKAGQAQPYLIGETYAWCGEKNKALEWLERAYDQRDDNIKDLKVDRCLYSVSGDSRFKAILNKLHLPE